MEEVIQYWKKELNCFNYTKDLDLKTDNYFGQFEENINMISATLNELERLQKENNDLRAIRETVRYLEEEGAKDDLYYVVGRGSYLAKVLENAKDFEKTVHTCLHCNENTPLYCENCYQELISKNAELQLKYEVFIETNYIPKTVIRDRIADLEEVKSKFNFLVGTSYKADGAINTLKELLGE